MNVELSSRAKLPKRRKAKPAIPPNVAVAMKAYAAQYKSVFKREPVMSYDKPYVRIEGKDGVSYKRLATLTQQLRDRAKDQA